MGDVARSHHHRLGGKVKLGSSGLGRQNDVAIQCGSVGGGATGIAGISPQRCGVVHHPRGQRQICEARAKIIKPNHAGCLPGAQQLPSDFVVSNLGNYKLVPGPLVSPNPLKSLLGKTVCAGIAHHAQRAAVQYKQHHKFRLEGAPFGAARFRQCLHEEVIGLLMLLLIAHLSHPLYCSHRTFLAGLLVKQFLGVAFGLGEVA